MILSRRVEKQCHTLHIKWRSAWDYWEPWFYSGYTVAGVRRGLTESFIPNNPQQNQTNHDNKMARQIWRPHFVPHVPGTSTGSTRWNWKNSVMPKTLANSVTEPRGCRSGSKWRGRLRAPGRLTFRRLMVWRCLPDWCWLVSNVWWWLMMGSHDFPTI